MEHRPVGDNAFSVFTAVTGARGSVDALGACQSVSLAGYPWTRVANDMQVVILSEPTAGPQE